MNALTAFGVDPIVTVVQGLLAADTRADKACGLLGVLSLEGDARVLDRLPRRHDGKLTEPVEQGELLRGEMLLGLEVADLRANLDMKLARIDDRQRSDDRASIADGVPEFRNGFSGRAENTEAGDDNSIH